MTRALLKCARSHIAFSTFSRGDTPRTPALCCDSGTVKRLLDLRAMYESREGDIPSPDPLPRRLQRRGTKRLRRLEFTPPLNRNNVFVFIRPSVISSTRPSRNVRLSIAKGWTWNTNFCRRVGGSETTDERTDGRTDGRTNGWTDGRTYGQTDRQTDGQMNWQIV